MGLPKNSTAWANGSLSFQVSLATISVVSLSVFKSLLRRGLTKYTMNHTGSWVSGSDLVRSLSFEVPLATFLAPFQHMAEQWQSSQPLSWALHRFWSLNVCRCPFGGHACHGTRHASTTFFACRQLDSLRMESTRKISFLKGILSEKRRAPLFWWRIISPWYLTSWPPFEKKNP